MIRRIKSFVKRRLRLLAPRFFARRQIRLLKNNLKDPELRLLPVLITEGSQFVDIGADRGAYTFHSLSYAGTAIAFEPRSEPRSAIAKLVKSLGLPVTIHPVALSDKEGKVILRIVSEAGGLSTIRQRDGERFELFRI